MKGFNTIFLDNGLSAHGRSADLFLASGKGTKSLAESRRMLSFLFWKCSRTTESKSEVSSARLIFSQLDR